MINTTKKYETPSTSADAQPIIMHFRKNLTTDERVDLLISYIHQNEGKKKEENRLTYAEIAQKIGVTTAAIYQKKSGLLTKAAKKMGVSRDSLLEHPHKAHQVQIYSVREVDSRPKFDKSIPEDKTPEQKLRTAMLVVEAERQDVQELAAKGAFAYCEMLKHYATAEEAFAAFECVEDDLKTAMQELKRFTNTMEICRVYMNVAADFAKQIEEREKYIAKKLQQIEELKAQCCKGYTIDELVSEDEIPEEKRIEIMSRIVFNPEESGYSEVFLEKAMELQPADFKKLILIIGMSEKELTEGRMVEWKFGEETMLTELLKSGGFNVTISKQSQS